MYTNFLLIRLMTWYIVVITYLSIGHGSYNMVSTKSVRFLRYWLSVLYAMIMYSVIFTLEYRVSVE